MGMRIILALDGSEDCMRKYSDLTITCQIFHKYFLTEAKRKFMARIAELLLWF